VGLAVGIGSLGRGYTVALPTATSEMQAGPTVAVAVSTATLTPRATATAKPTVTPTATEPATSTPEPITAIRAADGMIMVYVPAGTFAMGSTHGDSDETPVHNVTLDAFWLDQTEVTTEQYAAFLNSEGNQTEDGDIWVTTDGDFAVVERSGGTYRPRSGYWNRPVTDVGWYGARAYCVWVGGRLPTEAEWEYAAGGPESRIYPWGNAQRRGYANCGESICADGLEETAPVGSFPKGASWVGALDMAGNVWEWVADWYQSDYYSISVSTNPSGPLSGGTRVSRGGSWGDDWHALRATERLNPKPTVRSQFHGFRCAGDAPGQ
jgi:formylglycine-generating enzyme required for sulfatase activity